MRTDNRTAAQMRPVEIVTGPLMTAEGSALIKVGNTHVLCAATIEDTIPPFLRNSGKGWVTAEYSMLPRATAKCKPRRSTPHSTMRKWAASSTWRAPASRSSSKFRRRRRVFDPPLLRHRQRGKAPRISNGQRNRSGVYRAAPQLQAAPALRRRRRHLSGERYYQSPPLRPSRRGPALRRRLRPGGRRPWRRARRLFRALLRPPR